MTTPANPSAWIQVIRPWQFANGTLSYRAFVDQNDYGKLKSGKWIDIHVEPGEHVVEVVGRRSRSIEFPVTVFPGEVCKVECRTRVTYLAMVLGSYSIGFGKSPDSIELRTIQ